MNVQANPPETGNDSISENDLVNLILKISRELATTLDLEKALSNVILLSMQNVGAERGSLIAINERKEPILAAIYTDGHMVPVTEEQVNTILDSGLAGLVVKNHQSIWIKDTSVDQRWLHRPDDDLSKTGAKSAICLPLIVHQSLVGVLTIVHPKPGYFHQSQFELLQTIADIAAISIQNAILFDSINATKKRYQELFDDSIDPIILTDWTGTILEANRQAGRWLAEGVQMNIQDLLDINWDQVGKAFTHVRDGQNPNFESEFRAANSPAIPVDVFVHKVNINGQETIQWTLHDISERKALDSLRTDLMSMIYHDLRSPLANIISSLDLLKSLIPDDPSLGSLFEIAERSTDRMQRLIHSLLDINRFEAGQPITQFKAVDIPNLLQEAIQTVEPASTAKRQSIELNLPDELPTIEVDEDMIKRVTINLLENAIKFSPMDGLILVRARSKEKELEVSIKDSGPGIPADAKERIFNKFNRLDAKSFPKGIGLGLAFCKLAVNAHNGKIWVESDLGQGSCFKVSLPLNKAQN